MEFELEPRGSYYLSYTDKIMAGVFGGSPARGLYGSMVSGSNEYKLPYFYSDYFHKKNSLDASSFLRGIQATNNSKKYSDSIMPNFAEIYQLNGGRFINALVDQASWLLLAGGTYGGPVLKLFLTTGTITGSINSVEIGDRSWQHEYPFMGKYAGIARVLNPEKTEHAAKQDETIRSLSPFDPTLVFVPTDYTFSNKYSICFATGTNVAFNLLNYYDVAYDPTAYRVIEEAVIPTKKDLTGLSKKDLFACFFGFGVKPTQSITGSWTQGPTSLAFGVKIEGWKYGVLSGIPTSPKAVFRIGKFGQLRDMLEPRLYSKTLDPNTNTTDSPMLVNFLSGTQAYLTASSPLTLNLSDAGYYDLEYKCGRPYIEGAAY